MAKFQLSNNLLFVVIIIISLMILYFSWISSPRLSWNAYVPSWIANWADKDVNYNFRTAVPFLFLGLVSGMFLIIKRYDFKWWYITWLIHLVLVFIAELGQLYRPLRSFDVMDIIWGILGSGTGLFTIYIVQCVTHKTNKKIT